MPIRLKRPDGSVTPYKNAEYIPAYLFLPAAILDRCPQELQLPRTVASYFHDWNVISVVESDLFIELIMDGFAHLVWPYLGVSGYMENYSGYDPVYIIAHSPAFWVQTLQDEGIIPKVEDLMRSGQGEIMGFLPEAEVSACFEQIFPIAMDRYKLYDVIETSRRCAARRTMNFAAAMRGPTSFANGITRGRSTQSFHWTHGMRRDGGSMRRRASTSRTHARTWKARLSPRPTQSVSWQSCPKRTDRFSN